VSETLEEAIAEEGFSSPKEFFKMVSSVDLTNPVTYRRFFLWKEIDGSKKGLEKILKNDFTNSRSIK